MDIVRTNSPIIISEPNDKYPTGTFCGYGNTLWNIDTHKTLMVSGCYTRCIPKFLLSTNSAPDTHSAADNMVPTYGNVLGYYISVVEDEIGLYVMGVFHSTPNAQEARTKMLERQAALGPQANGFSIGFDIEKSVTVLSKDYDKVLPQYIPSNKLDYVMAQLVSEPFVKLVLQLSLEEISPTFIPSNFQSQMIEVRSKKEPVKTISSVKLRESFYANTYKEAEANIKRKNKNMKQNRAGRKLSEETESTLDDVLSKLEDGVTEHRDTVKEAMDDVKDSHSKLSKLVKNTRAAFESVRAKADEPDGDEPDDDPDEKDDDDTRKRMKDLETKLFKLAEKIK